MAERGVTVRETVKAAKTKFREDDLPGLLGGATTVLVGRGKSHVAFDPRTDAMDDIAAKVLGRSGTLRAPAARVGTTWLVGFTDDMWDEALG